MNQKKLPSIKKDIKNFLNSEEGKITKKSSFKIGSALGIIGIVLGNTISAAPSCDHSSHSSCHSEHNSCCTDNGVDQGVDDYGIDASYMDFDHISHNNCHDSCHSSHSSCCTGAF